jgi:hypothetical protein
MNFITKNTFYFVLPVSYQRSGIGTKMHLKIVFLGSRKYIYVLPVERSDLARSEGVHRFSKNLETTQNSGHRKGDMN